MSYCLYCVWIIYIFASPLVSKTWILHFSDVYTSKQPQCLCKKKSILLPTLLEMVHQLNSSIYCATALLLNFMFMLHIFRKSHAFYNEFSNSYILENRICDYTQIRFFIFENYLFCILHLYD